MSDKVKIVATLVARPGLVEPVRDRLHGLPPVCRFVLDEPYRDATAVAAHRRTAHVQNDLAQINDLAERTVLVLEPAKVA